MRFLKRLVLVTVPCLLGLGLALELGVRWALPVSDFPDTCFDPEIGNQFVASQSGSYVKGARGAIRGRYTINAQGWNATHDYGPKPASVYRVAVIGDSYVEALQLDVAKAFPALLEAELNPAMEWLQARPPSLPGGRASRS